MTRETAPIQQLAAKLPGPWDAIVGIPRGGLIVASLLGYALDVQRVGAFAVEYERHQHGPPTLGSLWCSPDLSRARHRRVLLVEDSTATGTLIEDARAWHEFYLPQAEIVTAALWVSNLHDYRPDVWVEAVDVLPSSPGWVTG